MGAIRHFVAVAVVGLGFSSSVFGSTLLFSDDYTATGNPNTNNLNFNLAGRESGTLGTGGSVNYGSNGGNSQVGNTTGGVDSGNYLLNAFNGISGPNQNFNQGPDAIIIGFDVSGNLRTTPGGTTYIAGTSSDWTALNIANSSTPSYNGVNAAGNNFGILFRGSGAWQAFSGGTLLGAGTAYADDGLLHHIDAVISDTTGTASGFAGNGTLITLYADHSLLPFISFSSAASQIPSYSNNQFAFQSNQIGAVDNLSVTLVPEPGSVGILAIGAIGLLARRRGNKVGLPY